MATATKRAVNSRFASKEPAIQASTVSSPSASMEGTTTAISEDMLMIPKTICYIVLIAGLLGRL